MSAEIFIDLPYRSGEVGIDLTQINPDPGEKQPITTQSGKEVFVDWSTQRSGGWKYKSDKVLEFTIRSSQYRGSLTMGGTTHQTSGGDFFAEFYIRTLAEQIKEEHQPKYPLPSTDPRKTRYPNTDFGYYHPDFFATDFVKSYLLISERLGMPVSTLVGEWNEHSVYFSQCAAEYEIITGTPFSLSYLSHKSLLKAINQIPHAPVQKRAGYRHAIKAGVINLEVNNRFKFVKESAHLKKVEPSILAFFCQTPKPDHSLPEISLQSTTSPSTPK